jgi:hypothetical protein
VKLAATTAAIFAATAMVLPTRATGSTRMPKSWHAPAYWFKQAMCIHQHEGAWNDATGNGYEGGMQFLRSTWTSVGGVVFPDGHWASEASPREQLYRAYLVWDRDAGRPHDGVGSWREWGTRWACGLS